MNSNLSPASKFDLKGVDTKPSHSISTGASQSSRIFHSVSSRDMLPSYKDTTFGSTKRMYMPGSHKAEFSGPGTTLDTRFGTLPKTPRKMLTDYGHDSPSPANYDLLHSLDSLRSNKGKFSFGKSKPNLAIVDAEVNISNQTPISISPGPGAYNPKLVEMGNDGPRYTLYKEKTRHSYLPNVMKYPALTKYDPKPTYLKRNFIRDGHGILRSEREFSYINGQKIPGPGDYHIKDEAYLPNKFTHGKLDQAPRDSFIKPNLVAPGPGYYDLVKPNGKYDWESSRSKAQLYREIRKPPGFRNR